jgi:hypothetical protein
LFLFRFLSFFFSWRDHLVFVFEVIRKLSCFFLLFGVFWEEKVETFFLSGEQRKAGRDVEVGWLCWQNTEFLGFLQQNRDFPTALH